MCAGVKLWYKGEERAVGDGAERWWNLHKCHQGIQPTVCFNVLLEDFVV